MDVIQETWRINRQQRTVYRAKNAGRQVDTYNRCYSHQIHFSLLQVSFMLTLDNKEDAILIVSIVCLASVADVDWVVICGGPSGGEEVVVVHEDHFSTHTIALEGHEVYEETTSSEDKSCAVRGKIGRKVRSGDERWERRVETVERYFFHLCLGAEWIQWVKKLRAIVDSRARLTI